MSESPQTPTVVDLRDVNKKLDDFKKVNPRGFSLYRAHDYVHFDDIRTFVSTVIAVFLSGLTGFQYPLLPSLSSADGERIERGWSKAIARASTPVIPRPLRISLDSNCSFSRALMRRTHNVVDFDRGERYFFSGAAASKPALTLVLTRQTANNNTDLFFFPTNGPEILRRAAHALTNGPELMSKVALLLTDKSGVVSLINGPEIMTKLAPLLANKRTGLLINGPEIQANEPVKDESKLVMLNKAELFPTLMVNIDGRFVLPKIRAGKSFKTLHSGRLLSAFEPYTPPADGYLASILVAPDECEAAPNECEASPNECEAAPKDYSIDTEVLGDVMPFVRRSAIANECNANFISSEAIANECNANFISSEVTLGQPTSVFGQTPTKVPRIIFLENDSSVSMARACGESLRDPAEIASEKPSIVVGKSNIPACTLSRGPSYDLLCLSLPKVEVDLTLHARKFAELSGDDAMKAEEAAVTTPQYFHAIMKIAQWAISDDLARLDELAQIPEEASAEASLEASAEASLEP
uniref:Uncharacterized protein n=1 Tax=Mycena chlorophos TaxID=658473 RepID=A0ABQ0KUU2_MYCCL|nr:predicted protein [Mycena chlorophos]